MLSPLDQALLENGFDESAIASSGRSDDPPSSAVLLIDPLIGPPEEQIAVIPPCDEDGNITKYDLMNWQKENLEELLRIYEQELAQIDHMAEMSYSALSDGTYIDTRAQFYYIYFTSLVNAPPETAVAKLKEMINLEKLWRNRQLKDRKGDDVQPEATCCVSGCPNLAMHGSRYCVWHILEDERQQAFEPCEICGKPKLKLEFFPCLGHDRFRKRAVQIGE